MIEAKASGHQKPAHSAPARRPKSKAGPVLGRQPQILWASSFRPAERFGQINDLNLVLIVVIVETRSVQDNLQGSDVSIVSLAVGS